MTFISMLAYRFIPHKCSTECNQTFFMVCPTPGHSFMLYPVSTHHLDGGNPLWMGRNILGRVNKNGVKYSKTIDIVSYASKVSVTCICSPFQVIRHIYSLETGLTVNIHVSTKPCIKPSPWPLCDLVCPHLWSIRIIRKLLGVREHVSAVLQLLITKFWQTILLMLVHKVITSEWLISCCRCHWSLLTMHPVVQQLWWSSSNWGIYSMWDVCTIIPWSL